LFRWGAATVALATTFPLESTSATRPALASAKTPSTGEAGGVGAGDGEADATVPGGETWATGGVVVVHAATAKSAIHNRRISSETEGPGERLS
jgi:hypothetical protein